MLTLDFFPFPAEVNRLCSWYTQKGKNKIYTLTSFPVTLKSLDIQLKGIKKILIKAIFL